MAVRIRDSVKVKGVLTTQVFADDLLGAYGFAGYRMDAPKRSWGQWAPTMRIIRDHLTFHGHDPL